ncbi:MAG TPA: methyltransferase domain-containing protein [Tepidisphaeraceae bacterium]|jgi:ubiquinone/menaquinone biosynthesis C-methylase UbiE|nr:methyltransferase domain-containing protein [Tepidisphaeraceae bacterium]
MAETQQSSGASRLSASAFWDALAPHHSTIENSYLDVPSIKRLMNDLDEPVLVVGGGQGLIVAEIRKNGMRCDGVDLSLEMIRYARLRRGIVLMHADAIALPIAERTYGTVIYATGVVDCTGDEERIRLMLEEGRRVVTDSGKIFIAFYRTSAAQERFLARVGLLSNNAMALRQCLELYLLNPAQMIRWVAKRAGLGYFRALILLLRVSALSTMQEKRITLRMQRMFRRIDDPHLLINAAPETQPFRNETEIRELLERLALPVMQLETYSSCYIVRIH